MAFLELAPETSPPFSSFSSKMTELDPDLCGFGCFLWAFGCDLSGKDRVPSCPFGEEKGKQGELTGADLFPTAEIGTLHNWDLRPKYPLSLAEPLLPCLKSLGLASWQRGRKVSQV
jgi:hypothetical protein